MPRKAKVSIYIPPKKKKRPGVHSKNASKNQVGYKKKYRGQGIKRWIIDNLIFIVNCGMI